MHIVKQNHTDCF